MARDESEKNAWDEIATAISSEPLPIERVIRDRPCLVVLAGSRMGESVNVSDGMTVGRGADADFQISDDGVSRIHLRLERIAKGRMRVIDQDSRNGTFVNGRRVTDALLRDGDKVYLGTKVIVRFSYADYLEEAYQQQMYEAALRDPLTGLFNRRHLLTQLDSEFRFVVRHSTPLTIVIIDLDHFKQLNDEHGHLVGDHALSGFGKFLAGAVRGGDVAARYGGEEFMLVCRGIRPAAGVKLANRLREALAGLLLVEEHPQLRMTFSAGVAGMPDPRINSPVELIRAADTALYEAKHKGRDRVEIAE